MSNDEFNKVELPAIEQLKKLINTNQYMSTMLSKDNRNNSIAAYRSAASRNQLQIEEFLRRWGAYRDPALMGPFQKLQPGRTNMERFEFIFKYLIRPDAMAGKYSTVSTEAGSIDIPYYKLNRNMISELTNFSGRNPEMRKYVDGFMRNWDTLYKGGSLENAIVVKENRILNENGLRYRDEFVNHKILDCIGDVMLAGNRIFGQIKTSQGGHQLTNTLLTKFLLNKSNWEFVSFDSDSKEQKTSTYIDPIAASA